MILYNPTESDEPLEIPQIQDVQDSSILYWTRPLEEYDCFSIFLMIVFFPISIPIWISNVFLGGFEKRNKRNELRKQHRARTLQTTNSVFMATAKYVGGHPLIPQLQKVLLGLSKTHFTIYSIDENYLVKQLASISLLEISNTVRGRPKIAREIYNEDHGHTIDVIKNSSFLSIIFKLEGHSYMASFKDFDENKDAPLEWSNQIIALRYQLMHEKNTST